MKYFLNPKVDGPVYTTEEDAIKLNANCPDSEKNGTGPGSCGGSKKGEKAPQPKKRGINFTPTSPGADENELMKGIKDFQNGKMLVSDKSGENVAAFRSDTRTGRIEVKTSMIRQQL